MYLLCAYRVAEKKRSVAYLSIYFQIIAKYAQFGNSILLQAQAELKECLNDE
jgi:hypothetical protein